MLQPALITRLSPAAKLGCWCLGVVAIAGGLQTIAMLLGLDFSVLEKSSGGTTVILAALGLLLAMMAVESRPLSDYGLVVDASWSRRAITGIALGSAGYLAYLAVTGWQGVLQCRPEQATLSQCIKAALAAPTAAPLAVTQQIIFSGYLLTTLRDKHSRAVAVLMPAILFALAASAGQPGGLFTTAGGRLFVSMLLLQSLLGTLRLLTGSIVAPAALLAGFILVRKIASKTRLLDFDWQHSEAWWLAPGGDPRQGALMLAILAAAAITSAVALGYRGEKQLDPDTSIDASFKRYLPFSNLLGLATLDRWLVVLWQARFRIGLSYLPRLTISLIGSTLSTLLALPERWLAPLLMRHETPAPVFIVGMPRSGTTHLHNLLALDPQFRSPRNYEVFNPHGFMTGWLTTALLTPFLTWRRPMDAVQMTVTSAQEEEFALAAMGSPSPYWSFCLPREIQRHDRYWKPEGFSAAEQKKWQSHYQLFLRKLTFWRRRTPLLKNPANTGRVQMLRAMYPDAKFIHIVRHPYAVWQSNQRLAEHGLAVFQLQDPCPEDNYATRTLSNYRSLVDAFYADTLGLPESSVAEVRFEDLEASPEESLNAIFSQLDISPSPQFEKRLLAYLEGVSGYRKNRFPVLPDAQVQQIDRVMGDYLASWGYQNQAAAQTDTPPRRAA